MAVNSLPKTITRQRRGCDLNPGPTAPESSVLTTRLPSHHKLQTLLHMTALVTVWDKGRSRVGVFNMSHGKQFHSYSFIY